MVVLVVQNTLQSIDEIKKVILEKHPDYLLYGFLDSNEAIKFSYNSRIDVVITDIRIDSMTGFGLISNIKETQPNIYTIIVTSNRDYASIAFQFGINSYLLTPLIPSRLNECLLVASRYDYK